MADATFFLLLKRRLINKADLITNFAGQNFGCRQTNIWLVDFIAHFFSFYFDQLALILTLFGPSFWPAWNILAVRGFQSWNGYDADETLSLEWILLYK